MAIKINQAQTEPAHTDEDEGVSYLHLSPLPQYGFNMVMSHPHAVNEIALSLNNRNPRSVLRTCIITKTTTTTAHTYYY